MKEHITQFVTDTETDVTNRIEQGKTKAFTNRQEALEYARKKCSYIYDLFCYSIINGNPPRKRIYGYAVPN